MLGTPFKLMEVNIDEEFVTVKTGSALIRCYIRDNEYVEKPKNVVITPRDWFLFLGFIKMAWREALTNKGSEKLEASDD